MDEILHNSFPVPHNFALLTLILPLSLCCEFSIYIWCTYLLIPGNGDEEEEVIMVLVAPFPCAEKMKVEEEGRFLLVDYFLPRTFRNSSSKCIHFVTLNVFLLFLWCPDS